MKIVVGDRASVEIKDDIAAAIFLTGGFFVLAQLTARPGRQITTSAPARRAAAVRWQWPLPCWA